MPDGEKKWWQVILQGEPDWPVFSEWMRETYGPILYPPINIFNFKSSEQYKFWVDQGKPTAKEWRAKKAKAEYLMTPWGERTTEARGDVMRDPEAKKLLPPPTPGYEWKWTPDPGVLIETGRPGGRWSQEAIVTEEGLPAMGIPLPSGFPQTYTNASGAIMSWDENLGQYTQIGFNPTGVYQPPPPVVAPTELQRWQMGEARQARKQQARLGRERILASKTGPRDWVEYWIYRNVTMPQREAQELREEAALLRENILGLPKIQAEQEAMRLEEQAAEVMRQIPAAKTPPSPEWLPEHLIGEGVPAIGSSIKPFPVRTPSPQLYGRMAPTAQLGLAGYADWAAPTSRVWQDIRGHYEQMLPQEVLGSRYTQWQPIRH